MDENKVWQKLIEQDSKLDNLKENMVTKQDLFGVLETLDNMSVILQRLDQERIFTAEWVRRIEAEVERHTKEIAQVKQQLKIV